MRRRLPILVLIPLLVGLCSCAGSSDSAGGDGGGARPLSGTWKVNIDPDRSIKLELNGSFDVREDKTEADAGETDVWVETYGTIKATNISDGRNVDGIQTGLQLFVPIEFCPDWDDLDPEGTHCTRDLLSFDIPDLDVDESEDIDISESDKVKGVPTDQAPGIIKSMLSDDAVVVSADRVFWNQYLDDLNPTCEFITSGDDTGTWVTYFTEDEAVTACATEAVPKP